MKTKSYIFFLYVIVFLIPFAGLRFKTGVDYGSYWDHYKLVPTIYNFTQTFSSMEIGYEYIASIFKTFDAPFYILSLFISALTFILFGRLCLIYSQYPTLSLLMFFSFAYWGQVMGQMRQPLAIFILYSFLFLLEKKKEKTFAIITITSSMLFHKANLFFLPPLFFLKYQLKAKQYWMILLTAIIGGFIIMPLAETFLKLLPSNMPFRNGIIAYLTYNSNPKIFTLGMVERIVLFSIITYLCSKYNSLQKTYDKLFYNMYFYGICLYFFFIHISSDFAARGSFILTFSMFFLFPNILKSIHSKRDYRLFLLIILLWSMYLASDIFSRGEIYIPYKSIFS